MLRSVGLELDAQNEIKDAQNGRVTMETFYVAFAGHLSEPYDVSL